MQNDFSISTPFASMCYCTSHIHTKFSDSWNLLYQKNHSAMCNPRIYNIADVISVTNELLTVFNAG